MSDEYQRLPPKRFVPQSRTLPADPAQSRLLPARVRPTPEQKEVFLERVALGRSLHGAASDAGKLPYMAFARERDADPAFERDLQIAMEARGGALLEIALEQCTVGVDEPLTYQGRITYEYPNGYTLDDTGNVTPETVRHPVTVKRLVTSNPMLLAFLKALYPKQFPERVEVTNNGPPATSIDEEQRRTLEYVKRDLLMLVQHEEQKPLDEEER